MDTNELAMAVTSISLLLVLVVKSAPTVISIAVGDARTDKGELMMLSSGISLAEGNEPDAVSKDVGISEPRFVAVAPTLTPVGTEST